MNEKVGQVGQLTAAPPGRDMQGTCPTLTLGSEEPSSGHIVASLMMTSSLRDQR